MNPEFELLDIVQSLNDTIHKARTLLVRICPHVGYTTYQDPTCHLCNVCGAALETDASDGTGNVLVPHRRWKGAGGSS